MKSKILIPVVLILLLLAPRGLQAGGLPVVDWSALVQRVLQTAKTLKQWYQYIEMYKKYHNEFKRYKYAFMTIYRGFKDLDSLDDFFINVDRIEQFMEMVYHNKSRLETWADIFNEVKELEEQYQNIDGKYLKENMLYKNPNMKPHIDSMLAEQENTLKNIKGGIELAINFRKTEEDVLKKIRSYQEKLGAYSVEGGETQDGTGTAEFNKMLLINSLTHLENLRVEAELTSLLRLNHERLLKLQAAELDEINRLGKMQNDEDANYSELKKGKK